MAVFDDDGSDELPSAESWPAELNAPQIHPKARSQITFRQKMIAGYDSLQRELMFTLPDDPLYNALIAEVEAARAELLRLMGVPPQFCHDC